MEMWFLELFVVRLLLLAIHRIRRPLCYIIYYKNINHAFSSFSIYKIESLIVLSHEGIMLSKLRNACEN